MRQGTLENDDLGSAPVRKQWSDHALDERSRGGPPCYKMTVSSLLKMLGSWSALGQTENSSL